eukprot:250160_1
MKRASSDPSITAHFKLKLIPDEEPHAARLHPQHKLILEDKLHDKVPQNTSQSSMAVSRPLNIQEDPPSSSDDDTILVTFAANKPRFAHTLHKQCADHVLNTSPKRAAMTQDTRQQILPQRVHSGRRPLNTPTTATVA